jgi:hypothetical protein
MGEWKNLEDCHTAIHAVETSMYDDNDNDNEVVVS